MPRAPDPRESEAYELYRNGLKCIEIAERLDIPPGTVRRWKSERNWDNDTERSQKIPSVRKERKQKIQKEVEAVSNNDEMTEKQKLFCLYYVRCFNATKAYQKAYGCKYTVANAEGYKMLVKPCVKEEIIRLKQNRLNRELLNEDDIFQRFMDIAYADITDYVEFGQEEENFMTKSGDVFTRTVNTVKLRESGEVDGSLISEVKHGKNGSGIKLHSQVEALKWIAEHMDMATAEQRARIAVLKKQSGTTTGGEDNTGVVLMPDILQGGEEDE